MHLSEPARERHEVVPPVTIDVAGIDAVRALRAHALGPHEFPRHPLARGEGHVDLPGPRLEPCGDVVLSVSVVVADDDLLGLRYGEEVMPLEAVSKPQPVRQGHIHVPDRQRILTGERDDVGATIPVEVPHHGGLPGVDGEELVPDRLASDRKARIAVIVQHGHPRDRVPDRRADRIDEGDSKPFVPLERHISEDAQRQDARHVSGRERESARDWEVVRSGAGRPVLRPVLDRHGAVARVRERHDHVHECDTLIPLPDADALRRQSRER